MEKMPVVAPKWRAAMRSLSNMLALGFILLFALGTMVFFVGSVVVQLIWDHTAGFCLRRLRRVRAQ